MATKANSHVPGTSDEAVKAKTGKDWAGWFSALDKAGAARLKHSEIAKLLAENYDVPGWWCQNITVEYERARGLRELHQKGDGYSVSASKTIATTLPKLYRATADAASRRKWFPKGSFELSSQTENKYFRGSWNEAARLEIGFYSKGENKAQIALAVNRLADRTQVEREREAWKAALDKLKALLEK